MSENGGAGGGTREPVRAYDPEASFQLLGDPVAQWLDWEEQANLIGFRVSTVPVEVALSKIDRDALEIYPTTTPAPLATNTCARLIPPTLSSSAPASHPLRITTSGTLSSNAISGTDHG